MVWDESDFRVTEKQTTSAQHMWELLQGCWKSIPFLFERMPRACKGVKAKGGYFEESKIYFDLLNTFLVTLLFHVCYFIVLMSSPLFYNVENSKNKEKLLNE
jgi:hypothetical protein